MTTTPTTSPRLLGATSMTVPFPTLAEVKAKLGIDSADTSKDQAIINAMNATVAIIETYLQRGIAFARMTQQFDPIETRNARLFLFRYPVQTVYALTIDDVVAADASFRVYKPPGILEWRAGFSCWRVPSLCCGPEPSVTIDYEGGYPDDAWPADLCEAVLQVFYARWEATAGGTQLASTGGAIKSWSADGLAIQYDTSAVALGATLEGEAIPPDLIPIAAMIEPYRARRVPGV